MILIMTIIEVRVFSRIYLSCARTTIFHFVSQGSHSNHGFLNTLSFFAFLSFISFCSCILLLYPLILDYTNTTNFAAYNIIYASFSYIVNNYRYFNLKRK